MCKPSVTSGMLVPSFLLLLTLTTSISAMAGHGGDQEVWLDVALEQALAEHNFTGSVEFSLESLLGRPLNPALVELGRLLFFDEILSLKNDNACGGCHSPAVAFGDPGSVAIGVNNNRVVGPLREGPRNFRRAPILTNVGFYPRLMLNSRFEHPNGASGDPFDNSDGFKFPAPHDDRFQPGDPLIPNLLTAQAFLPVQDLTEMAGFQGTAGTGDIRFDQFDDGVGQAVPAPPNRPEKIRDLLVERLATIPGYESRFATVFGTAEINFSQVGQAIAEFQISLSFANAPIDRFARGEKDAMTNAEKRGALLFFGKAGCVRCHQVSGSASEMFTDFDHHVVGVPQIHPLFGRDTGNVLFDGPEHNEDFGRFQISGEEADRYAFRTSPLRNIGVQPTFFHNGAFTDLEAAIRHHLDVFSSSLSYNPSEAGVSEDLRQLGPLTPVLERLDPRLQTPLPLDEEEVADLVAFIRTGLLDPRALPKNTCKLIPNTLPSGRLLPWFQGCNQSAVTVCHDPLDSLEKPQEIMVAGSAVLHHLKHGDRVGHCE